MTTAVMQPTYTKKSTPFGSNVRNSISNEWKTEKSQVSNRTTDDCVPMKVTGMGVGCSVIPR